MTEEKKVEGVCLRSTEVGEGDRIITLLTDSCGKIAVKVRGVSSPKSRLRQAAVPFAFGQYVLLEKNGYHSLKSFDFSDPFTQISDDLLRYYLGASALEIADKLTEEDISVSRELARLLRFLMSICYDGGGVSAFIMYVLDFLKIAGYGMQKGDYDGKLEARFFVFDLEEGALRLAERKPPYVFRLSPTAVRFLAAYLDGEEPDAEANVCCELFSLFAQYIRYKTGSTVKSFFELSDLIKRAL